MRSIKIRQKFLNFFKKRGHTIVPSSSLLPTDHSVLFTTAGMQQFKNYYLGEPCPYGKNVASCQKCFRTSDIEEVGDERHLTFLEMLGNFSFGGYFKKEAIEWAFELLNSYFKIPKSKMSVTVFGGDEEVPRDEESVKIWKRFGFSEKNGKLHFSGREDNFWGPTGLEGPCGPTTEIYINGIEVWNLVFNEYFMSKEKKLTPLTQKGVDTGMGLERLTMVLEGKSNVFETDLFLPIIKEIKNIKNNFTNIRAQRIISDHIKSSVFLISEGVLPSNVERGYILRRLLRRAIRYGKILNMKKNFLIPLAQKVIEVYKNVYSELKSAENDILTVIQNEEEKFEKTLLEGLKKLDRIMSLHKEKLKNSIIKKETIISGKEAFDLYQSYGFPLELTKELALEKGFKVDENSFKEEFKKHQEISRMGAEKKFGGGGYFSPKLHTATHLLHAALRKILGDHVKQMGSDITTERLRFDFSHSQKLTPEEIKKVEDLVNQKIKENLEVKEEKMPFQKAIDSGALAFFKEKYPPMVSVYSIGDFSREICAGPHVRRTLELGKFKIVKEESCGAGVRRIKAILIDNF